VKSPFRINTTNNNKKSTDEKKIKRKFDSLILFDEEITSCQKMSNIDVSSSSAILTDSDNVQITGSNESVGKRFKVDGIVDQLLLITGYTSENFSVKNNEDINPEEIINFSEQLSPTKELLINEDDIKKDLICLGQANLKSPIVAKMIDLDDFKSRNNKYINLNIYFIFIRINYRDHF